MLLFQEDVVLVFAVALLSSLFVFGLDDMLVFFSVVSCCCSCASCFQHCMTLMCCADMSEDQERPVMRREQVDGSVKSTIRYFRSLDTDEKIKQVGIPFVQGAVASLEKYLKDNEVGVMPSPILLASCFCAQFLCLSPHPLVAVCIPLHAAHGQHEREP